MIYPTENSKPRLGGWLDRNSFTTCGISSRFSNPMPTSPVLLLLDNHSWHLSVEALDLAVENDVHILSFPPHCSYRLQPLDVSVLGSVKTTSRMAANKILEWKYVTRPA